MTRQRPVPRTLSEILRRLTPREQNAPELMPPEMLQKQTAPIVDPEALFRGVAIRPGQPLPTPDQMKTPAHLFGEQQIAEPGHVLKSPHELDLLPGQPLPEIHLEPLASFLPPEKLLPAENDADDTASGSNSAEEDAGQA